MREAVARDETEDQVGDGEARGGDHAGDGDVAREAKGDEPNDDRGDGGDGENGPHGHERAEGSGDTLAAGEGEENREHMTKDGSGGHGQPEPQLLGGEVGRLATEDAGGVAGGEDGDGAFEEVENETEDAKLLAQDAADVGSADVLGAVLADVDVLGASDEDAEGDRAQEVGCDDEDDPGEDHARMVADGVGEPTFNERGLLKASVTCAEW